MRRERRRIGISSDSGGVAINVIGKADRKHAQRGIAVRTRDDTDGNRSRAYHDEFASRVFHVHAKDTLFLDAELYELGNLQPATFSKPHLFGGYHWRYAIPGHGSVPWTQLFSRLEQSAYRGIVSVELEDEDTAALNQPSSVD